MTLYTYSEWVECKKERKKEKRKKEKAVSIV
jgi:hypothetical protein